MSRIFWDTNIYIYLLEGVAPFFEQANTLRSRMLERHDELLTSTMTLGEIQVGPRRMGNAAWADQSRDAVLQTSTVLAFDTKAADLYTKLRMNLSVKAPDAIQLSCAAAAGVELFVTNDKALHNLSVPGIHFITSLDRVPF